MGLRKYQQAKKHFLLQLPQKSFISLFTIFLCQLCSKLVGSNPKLMEFGWFGFTQFFEVYNNIKLVGIQRWEYKQYSWNLKYNRIDMKRRTSQKILKPNRKLVSATKQLPVLSTASDSLKAPKRKPARKNRQFGDDITNLQKQPVFQAMTPQELKPQPKETTSKLSEIQPYLPEISAHIQQLDDAFNVSVMTKLYTKSSDSTEVTLEMRKILVKWILQVAEKFKANQETVHISIQIIDYILVFSHKKITKVNFQLLGISSLFVASKYNEIYTPEAKKYIYVCDGLYTLQDLFSMQSYILTLTNFNLQFPTLNSFIGPLTHQPHITQDFRKTAQIFTKMSVLDFNLFNRFKKQHVTGAILYLTSRLLKLEDYSAQQVMRQINMDQQTFKNCFSTLFQLYRQQCKPQELNPQNKQ